MCRGCFNQLFLRDEFHSGGIAALLGKAGGMPTRRAFMAYSVGAASALGAVGAAPAFAADGSADLILRGGTVRPLPGAPVASAIAVKDGKVLAVGEESTVMGLKTGDTKIVDLAGRTLFPGLIDPHNHTILASLIFRSARRRRLRQISDPRETRRASQAGGGRHAQGPMDRRLQF